MNDNEPIISDKTRTDCTIVADEDDAAAAVVGTFAVAAATGNDDGDDIERPRCGSLADVTRGTLSQESGNCHPRKRRGREAAASREAPDGSAGGSSPRSASSGRADFRTSSSRGRRTPRAPVRPSSDFPSPLSGG